MTLVGLSSLIETLVFSPGIKPDAGKLAVTITGLVSQNKQQKVLITSCWIGIIRVGSWPKSNGWITVKSKGNFKSNFHGRLMITVAEYFIFPRGSFVDEGRFG